MTNGPSTFERTEPATCRKHGDYTARILDLAHLEIAEGMPPVRMPCPKCAAERDAAEAEAERRREQAARAAALQARIGRIGIPARFADRTLSNYRAEAAGQKRALSLATAMAESDVPGTSLILCGKPGTGKTHLAIGIAQRFAERGKTALFQTVLSAMRHVKSTYGANSDRTETQAMADLCSPDLLILDEVGVQSGTEYEKMLVFEVINERYQQCRSTILISNLTLPELTEYLGDRLIDRFREVGGVVAFDWESWRVRRPS